MERKIVLSEQQIQDYSVKLGAQLSDILKDDKKPPLFVCVLKGATLFMVDLIKNVKIPIYIDFIHVTSYQGTSTTGNVKLVEDTTIDCEGRTVVIVEDVIDTGHSFKFLQEHFLAKNPKQILTCVMVDKKFARKVPYEVDFAGYILEKPAFLMGYGLDYNEIGRNTPYIYEATEEDIKIMDDLNNR